MVFYETTLLIRGNFPANEARLLLRESVRTITDQEGSVFRILDLGWRHTAQPVTKPRVGVFHYGRWYVMNWGGPPTAVGELKQTFQYNTGVLRFLTQKLRGPNDMYRPRSTYYPVLKPNEAFTPPLSHHTPMRDEVR
mmetsp:Transcript_17075/g.43936  ORF Transcript_17075/g.43936 Transcript_17075/m.43936 type:complete len:137 (-) Transcript_17075:102-512(-)